MLPDLEAFLAQQPLYSTHEHLRYEADALAAVGNKTEDILWLFTVHYTSSDLRSAGASVGDINFIQNIAEPFARQHERLVQFAMRCRNTTQMRVLHHGLRELYGGDVYELSDAEEMQRQREAAHGKGIYREILQRRGLIKLLCRDCGERFDEPEYFRTAIRMEEWIGVSSLNQLRVLEERSGTSIHSLSDLTAALRSEAQRLIGRGAIAFKNAMIYRRDPTWMNRSFAEAERGFNALCRIVHAEWVDDGSAWSPKLRALQDYLYGELCALAAANGIPMQIHTGVPEGNLLPVAWGDPFRLLGLIRMFPSLQIHLLHVAHPFEREAASLAKVHPNVYIDCSWIHQLNAHATRFYLNWLLDEVPYWKILGFGGDYAHVEGVFAHLLQARHNLSIALRERIDVGACDVREAHRLLTAMLWDNPKRVLYNRETMPDTSA